MQISANSTIIVVKQERIYMSIQYRDLLDIDECRDNDVNYYLTEYEFFCPAEPIIRERQRIYEKYRNFIVKSGDKICQ